MAKSDTKKVVDKSQVPLKERPAGTYLLPPEAAIALQTRRTQFLDTLTNALVDGKRELTRDQQVGLVGLCRELVEAESRDHARLTRMEQVLKSLDDVQKGLRRASNEMTEIVKRVRQDLPLEEGEALIG